jgi:uncharacterized protein (TIGR02466 family)
MDLQLIFPVSVGFFNLNRDLTEEELSCLLGFERKKNEGNSRSAHSHVLGLPQLKSLKDFIYESVDHYFTEIYRPLFDVKLQVTQSWVNYTDKGQFHHKHRHSNSFVSGVFYATTNDSDSVMFYKASDQSLRITPKEHTINNSESWWFPTKQNSLILFPSNLDHMVGTKQTDGTRVSVAFNTFPVGVVGDRTALNEAVLAGVADHE